ncbi:hypothetical protein LGR54_01685 [Ancylobacter sp. Lp-2]|nr:hypothetical protein [Ancylobacter sp. Lp-2]MCB4767304.1 hypothetical protein [Ancylobacter sp. Lp-2]
MQFVIEFYRTRERDYAHAVVGRETVDAVDLDAAIGLARSLAQSLEMPQRPDALGIVDENGHTLHSCTFDAALGQEERLSP